MTKQQKIERATRICQLYATGEYTIESCCQSEGIPYRTFIGWALDDSPRKVAEVADYYKKACEDKANAYKSKIKRLAKTAMERKLEGWPIEEITYQGKTGNKVIKKVTKVHIPDTALIIFALSNTDPENFKNKQETDVKVVSDVEVTLDI